MPPLRQLQSDLQKYLVGEASDIADAIVDAPPLPIDARLGIYRNAYQVRLIEALDDTYPVLHAVLGDEEFAALGERFVAAQPSVHRSIRWYGGELAYFLAHQSPYAEQPIFAELARLEWTMPKRSRARRWPQSTPPLGAICTSSSILRCGACIFNGTRLPFGRP
jgi:hypothetical protein